MYKNPRTAKCYIFDLDGTIYDSYGDIAYCCNEALMEFSLPAHEKEKYLSFIGNGEKLLIERAVGKNLKNDKNFSLICDKIRKRYKEIYIENYNRTSKPFYGITELLNELKSEGKIIFIASNKSDSFVREINKTVFNGVFDDVVGKKDGYEVKPDNKAVNELIEKFNLSPGDCFFIGDSDVDVETAYRAYMKSILVTYGYGNKEQALRMGPHFVVETVSDLRKLICEK